MSTTAFRAQSPTEEIANSLSHGLGAVLAALFSPQLIRNAMQAGADDALAAVVYCASVIVLFSVANRGPVRVSLDPFSRDLPMFSIELPLFAVVLAAIAVGGLVGGLASWDAQGKHRKAAGRNRRGGDALGSETQALRSAVPDSALPALTNGRT